MQIPLGTSGLFFNTTTEFYNQLPSACVRETLINGPTSEVAGEMASNFLDDEANRRSIQ
ncbi:hypothetical protein KTF20_32565 [Burkholderia multivorans]|uniref:hypothetical protein n=1 Tax=Burkholderia multivorans TaxID=87883 RepID=UPI001C21C41A|nr:hypothetical protein [Burkholderia multivorans]MBU9640142.1 hypothetical protein [Burkholderia multivorans]